MAPRLGYQLICWNINLARVTDLKPAPLKKVAFKAIVQKDLKAVKGTYNEKGKLRADATRAHAVWDAPTPASSSVMVLLMAFRDSSG